MVSAEWGRDTAFFQWTSHWIYRSSADGAPSATGYDGEDAREHVWEVVREGKKRGIEVLSVGIDNFEQADMYEEFIPYSGPEITTKISQWIRKKFMSIADDHSF